MIPVHATRVDAGPKCIQWGAATASPASIRAWMVNG